MIRFSKNFFLIFLCILPHICVPAETAEGIFSINDFNDLVAFFKKNKIQDPTLQEISFLLADKKEEAAYYTMFVNNGHDIIKNVTLVLEKYFEAKNIPKLLQSANPIVVGYEAFNIRKKLWTKLLRLRCSQKHRQLSQDEAIARQERNVALSNQDLITYVNTNFYNDPKTQYKIDLLKNNWITIFHYKSDVRWRGQDRAGRNLEEKIARKNPDSIENMILQYQNEQNAFIDKVVKVILQKNGYQMAAQENDHDNEL